MGNILINASLVIDSDGDYSCNYDDVSMLLLLLLLLVLLAVAWWHRLDWGGQMKFGALS